MFCSNCGKNCKKPTPTNFDDTNNKCSHVCCSNKCLQELYKKLNIPIDKDKCGICSQKFEDDNIFLYNNNIYHIICFHKWLKKNVEEKEHYYQRYIKQKNNLEQFEEEFKEQLIAEKL